LLIAILSNLYYLEEMDPKTNRNDHIFSFIAIPLLVLSTTMPISKLFGQNSSSVNNNKKMTLSDLQGTWTQDHFSYLACFDGKGVKSYHYIDSIGNFGIIELELRNDTAYMTTPTLDREFLLASLHSSSNRLMLELQSPRKIFKKKSHLFFIELIQSGEILISDLDYYNCRDNGYFSRHTKYYMKQHQEK
jgi:hypothetical protein